MTTASKATMNQVCDLKSHRRVIGCYLRRRRHCCRCRRRCCKQQTTRYRYPSFYYNNSTFNARAKTTTTTIFHNECSPLQPMCQRHSVRAYVSNETHTVRFHSLSFQFIKYFYILCVHTHCVEFNWFRFDRKKIRWILLFLLLRLVSFFFSSSFQLFVWISFHFLFFSLSLVQIFIREK